MNGDTVYVNPPFDDGPRAKRVRTSGPEPALHTSFRFKQYQGPTKSVKKGDGTEEATNGTANTLGHNQGIGGNSGFTPVNQSISLLDSKGGPTSSVNLETPTPAPPTARRRRRGHGKLLFKAYNPPGQPKAPSVTTNDSPHNALPSQGTHAPSEPSIPRSRPSETKPSELSKSHVVNFASMPDDPVELAWWIAHQIGHLHVPDTTPTATQADNLSHSAAMMRQWLDRNGTNSGKLGSPHAREQARKRQQRWRASHRERKNLNDLRSRINREAKMKFGSETTDEKTTWIKEELAKRQRKLEAKQRASAAETVSFPDFRISEDAKAGITARASALTAGQQKVQNDVADLLFAYDSKKTNNQLLKTAKDIQDALAAHDMDKADFLRPILLNFAASSEASNSIRAELGEEEADHVETDLPEEESSIIEAEPAAATATDKRRVSRRSTRTSIKEQAEPVKQGPVNSSELMKAIDGAVAILAQINDTTTEIPSTSSPRKQSRPRKGTKKANPPGIDLDAFLMTANAGLLVDDEEDEDVADANDDSTIDLNLSPPKAKKNKTTGKSSSDSDIWNTIDHVIDELVSKRVAFDTKQNRKKSGRFDAQEQAEKARKLLADANLRANFAMTKAKSEAISHLYSQLVGLLNSEPPRRMDTSTSPTTTTNIAGAATPFAEKVNGQTKATVATVRKKTAATAAAPSPAAPSSLPPQLPPTTTTTKPTTTKATLPEMSAKYKVPILSPFQQPRARTEEEERKIKSYGFPPLPGSKVGTPRP